MHPGRFIPQAPLVGGLCVLWLLVGVTVASQLPPPLDVLHWNPQGRWRGVWRTLQGLFCWIVLSRGLSDCGGDGG